jgi:hypothetical protein
MIKIKRFEEKIELPIEQGDTILHGKFKNKSSIYDHYYINEKGDVIFVTNTGKEIPAMKIRLKKKEK